MTAVTRDDNARTLIRSYIDRDAATLVAIARRERTDIVVANRRWHPDLPGMRPILREEDWQAWAFPDSDAIVEGENAATRPRFLH